MAKVAQNKPPSTSKTLSGFPLLLKNPIALNMIIRVETIAQIIQIIFLFFLMFGQITDFSDCAPFTRHTVAFNT